MGTCPRPPIERWDIMGTNFFSPSYDPAQRLFFVNARGTCAIYYSWNEPFREGQQYESGGTTRPRDHRNFGALRAIDPLTGERKWEFRYPTPSSSGILTTASGLVSRVTARGTSSCWTRGAASTCGITRSAWVFGHGRNHLYGRWPPVSSRAVRECPDGVRVTAVGAMF
jgi:hypothetical protein